MKQYIHIKADSTITVVDVPGDGDAEYHQMVDLVGGYIERVRVAWGGHNLIINEEGHLKGLDLNIIGTALTGRIGSEWPIVGDAILVGPLFWDDFRTVDPHIVEAASEGMANKVDALISAVIKYEPMPGRAGNGGTDA